MKIKVTNISEVAVGVASDRAPLLPGESIELELDGDDVNALEGFDHVEVQHLDRPEGGGHKKAAAKSDHKGSGE